MCDTLFLPFLGLILYNINIIIIIKGDINMPKWLKNSIFYQIYPQSFYDSNGDGIGDIQGIIQKLDYIKDLGCNAIWLNPIYDSPFMDAGYDVRNYNMVAPRYGTNNDLEQLFTIAHSKGIKVLLDLVPGHTSDQCNWFLQSKKHEKNEFSNRYIWTNNVWESPMEYKWVNGVSERNGNYLTNFFSSQPALNYGFAKITHPKWQLPVNHPNCQKTVETIKNIMRFWLNKGCDGFRVDMADSLVKNEDDKKETSKIWRGIRQMLDEEYPEAALISEWGNPERAINEGGFHCDFYLDHRGNGYSTMFRYINDETNLDESYFCKDGIGDITTFTEEYTRWLKKTKGNGYISLITGNHDVARMTRNLDNRSIRLAYTTILTMPGVPFIYYGDEIGMRYIENLPSKEGGYNRTGSRTPMQWNSSKNLGFSTAESNMLYLPVDSSKDAPTVENQKNKQDSIYETVRTVIRLRREHDDLGSDGDFEVLYAEKGKYPFIYKRGNFVIAVNPSKKSQIAPLQYQGKKVFEIGNTTITEDQIGMDGQSIVIINTK